jgi:hypothetical protein
MLMEHLVLIALEPRKGSVACKVQNCRKKARVQIIRYLGLEPRDVRYAGSVCYQHLAKFEGEWTDREYQKTV